MRRKNKINKKQIVGLSFTCEYFIAIGYHNNKVRCDYFQQYETWHHILFPFVIISFRIKNKI